MAFKIYGQYIQELRQGKTFLPKHQRFHGGQGVHHRGEAYDSEKTAYAASFRHGSLRHVHAVLHAQIVQAGQKRRCNVERTQPFQYGLLPESQIQHIQ